MSSQQSGNLALDESLSYDEVSKLFSLPIADAANILGVCSSVLKKICRENGVVRWPYRKFLAGKSVEEIKKDAARERNRELAALSRAARQSGSQLQNKTSSFVQNTSILPGVTTQAHILQQQGNRVFQNGRPQHMLNSSLTKGIPNCLDEFKHGFPTNGLSTDSIRWWGSSSPDGSEEIFEDEAETDHEDKQQSQELADDEANSLIVEDKKPERGNESDIGPQGTGLLSAVRKRAAEDGQEALKLGVCSSYREYKLGRKERVLLHRLFNSSLPSEWSCGSS